MGDMSREPSMEDILSSIRRVIARDEAPGTAPAPRGADDVLDLRDEDAGETASKAPATNDELVSTASADAARQSLEALSAAIGPAAAAAAGAAPPVPVGRTIEDVVVDALRPMLKDWLDAHLPEIVEAMVAKEISRIAGKRG